MVSGMKKHAYKILFLSLLLLGVQSVRADRTEPDYQRNLPKKMWGYVNAKGKVVISPKYARADPFMHGFALCYGYSPTTGKPDYKSMMFVDKAGHQYVMPSDGKEPPKPVGEAYYELDLQGKQIIRDTFTSILSTRGELMLLKRTDDFSVCDKSGHNLVILPPSWIMYGQNLRTGNYRCCVGRRAYEFTGATGKSFFPGFEQVEVHQRIPARYDYSYGLSEGLAAVRNMDGHWAYVDNEDKIQIDLPKDCSNAQPFSEGLAAVSIGGKPWSKLFGHARMSSFNGATFGFIDKTGRFVIPPRFPCPPNSWNSQFKNGLAPATTSKNGDVAFGCIDKKGRFVVPAIYKAVGNFSEGLVAVNTGPVGFDKELWAEEPRGAGSRMEQFSKFLRQYDFIGMTRSRVVSLLGQPDGLLSDTNFYYYTIESACTQSIVLVVKYKNDCVTAYSIGSVFFRSPKFQWITKRVKPDVDEDLIAFCRDHADQINDYSDERNDREETNWR